MVPLNIVWYTVTRLSHDCGFEHYGNPQTGFDLWSYPPSQIALLISNLEYNELFEKQCISHFESITPGEKMSWQFWCDGETDMESKAWILVSALSLTACDFW